MWEGLTMRLSRPRIPALADHELDEEQREALEPYRSGDSDVFNIFRTLAHAPRPLRRFGFWAGYVLGRHNSLPPRERELVILRVGYLCKAGYEWAQHVVIGRNAGLTDEEIERIKAGADAEGWSPGDAALLRATDELVDDHFISDDTWAALARDAGLDDRQRMDVVFTTGQYTQVSMMLNTFGVQLDEFLVSDPDLTS
jgi:alkylhydroperoxidase family enzyme